MASEIPYEITKENCLISTDKARLNIDLIHRYLTEESYWAAGIPKTVVENAVANSLCFGLYIDNVQAGFARLVTDKATFAYLADVFILSPYRGRGLSKWLIESIQAHPELQGLRRWLLATRDAHGLYAQMGWKEFDEVLRQRFMQRHFPDVYRS